MDLSLTMDSEHRDGLACPYVCVLWNLSYVSVYLYSHGCLYAYRAFVYARRKDTLSPKFIPCEIENKEQEFELDPKIVIYVSSMSTQ